jgi:hypothetical protein
LHLNVLDSIYNYNTFYQCLSIKIDNLYSFGVFPYIQCMRITSSLQRNKLDITVNSAQLNESARLKLRVIVVEQKANHKARDSPLWCSNWNKLSNDTSSAPPMHASPDNFIALMPIHRKHTYAKSERRCLVSTQHAVWNNTACAHLLMHRLLFSIKFKPSSTPVKKDICKFVCDVTWRGVGVRRP